MPREVDNSKGSEKDMNVDSARCFTVGSSQDPLFLEAYLRSKLFSRFGVIDSSKKTGTHSDSKSTAAKVTEENFASRKTQIVGDNVMLSDSKDISAPNGEGSVEPDNRISETILNIENQKPVEEHSLNNSRALAFDYEDTIFHSKEITSASIISSSSIFRSAMMAACRSKLNDVQIIEQQEFSPGMHIDNELLPRKSEDESSLEKAIWPEEVIKSVSFGRIDSYAFKGVIDPFRPLCMHELRGRCNNDECPWQHLRDKSSRNVNEHDSCDDGAIISKRQSHYMVILVSTFVQIVSLGPHLIPRNRVSKLSLTHGSPLARHIGASPKNIFSSLAVSNSLVKQHPSDEPYLHGNDGCVDSFVGGGHSLYFQSRNGAGNPLRNGFGDNDQALEIGLLVLNQEVNSIDGMKKALSVLSRTLEADCALFQLWIVYLLLYHSTVNSVSELSKKTSSVEDDLFSHAVKHNTQSYELWLLYINSRRRLNDCFAAYERALSCLCHHASAKNGHAVCESAAILDLFLQMLHCFCISGNVAKAVQRIQGLVRPDRDSDESHSLLLSDILQCLTMSDKCIFWVSCVYLVIYRKLPDALVQQFEYEKDISVIEWPSVRLPLEGKQQVFKLIELAVDSLRLHVDSESSESRNHKSAHLIALSHIHLVAAVDGEERCKMLLEKYKNSYPSCLQLSLLSARAHGNNDENKKFDGFEEALGNWPTEVPGIRCIWNQFAEYAIKNGRPDRAKEIMDQPLSHDRSVDSENDDNRTSSPDPLSESNLNALLSDFTNMDFVFGLLNLSLLRLFQNDVLAAHTAVDEALKTADTEALSQCVREPATFLFHHRSQLEKDSSLRGLMDILKRYVVHTQSVSAPGCLTTKFIDDLKKPRLRQLVSNILCPTSPACLVNSVLDTWFGPSLLPQNTDELKDLVDFIEFILEVSPATVRLIWKNQDGGKSKSPGVFFWASSLLVNTIYRAIPVPPEFVWAEAADLLGKLTDKLDISKSFQQRALLVYPFSVRLWKSFLKISAPGKRSNVIQAARDKGMELDYDTASHSS
ncbi:hypothetical protein Cgig2_019809 [Carnegiea gigantea]|uniref:C3H1-type domain-containing protein n=1 Tax=Carnegiea gigantea TaxID=171969 RepID=A0A9Q1Q9Z3_9CARY|nr:hypothetical protein Cgig2_019809 [Carnegiea gigantea]